MASPYWFLPTSISSNTAKPNLPSFPKVQRYNRIPIRRGTGMKLAPDGSDKDSQFSQAARANGG
jgi:hypothetical protein